MPVPSELHSEMMLRAMVLASIADGVRPEAEDRVALAIHAGLVGVRLPKAEYERICAAVSQDPEGAWRWLAEREEPLSPAQREDLVRAVIRVAMADAEL